MLETAKPPRLPRTLETQAGRPMAKDKPLVIVKLLIESTNYDSLGRVCMLYD
jgi:hypothetical protein